MVDSLEDLCAARLVDIARAYLDVAGTPGGNNGASMILKCPISLVSALPSWMSWKLVFLALHWRERIAQREGKGGGGGCRHYGN